MELGIYIYISLGIQSYLHLRRYCNWTLHTYITVSPITVPEKVFGSLGYMAVPCVVSSKHEQDEERSAYNGPAPAPVVDRRASGTTTRW